MKRKASANTDLANCPLPAQIGQGVLHPTMKQYSGYCFFKAAARIKARFDEAFVPFGVVGAQFGILVIVKEEGPLTQNELGKYLAIDKATMVRFIDHLEESKLLTRKQSREDRRANHLEITKKGEQMIAKLNAERKRVEQEFFKALSKAEQEQLHSLIQKILL